MISAPFEVNDIEKIIGSEVAPFGLATQETIDKFGQVISKFRPAHDQSFDTSPENSVKNRLIR